MTRSKSTIQNFSFPRYPRYRDSGVEWLGDVPEHWESEKGKWLFLKMDRPVIPDDGVVTAFRDGQVTLRTNRRTEGFTNAIKEHGYQRILKGDLVIHAMDAFAGAIGVSDSDGKSTPVYSACVPRKPNTVSPEFYAYLLRYMAHSGFITTLSKGIRERSTDFRFNDFGALDLPLPPKPEQDRIVIFLDRKTAEIDTLISKKQRQIELINEQKTILINRAVTRGLNPNVKLKPSGLEWIGEIPAHWGIRKARHLFRQEERAVRKTDDVVTAFRDGQVTLRSKRRTEGFTFAILEQGYQGIEPGDLVIHGMDAFAGAIGVSEDRGKCTPEYIILNPIIDGIDNGFFALHLREMAQSGYIHLICPSVRERAPRFRFPKLADAYLTIPPIDEQLKIVSLIGRIKNASARVAANLVAQIDGLKTLRSTLIAHAVTGRIKV